MERIKQNLENAKADLLFYQRNIYEIRLGRRDPDWASTLEIWIASRHRAADRVADLQQMASPSI